MSQVRSLVMSCSLSFCSQTRQRLDVVLDIGSNLCAWSCPRSCLRSGPWSLSFCSQTRRRLDVLLDIGSNLCPWSCPRSGPRSGPWSLSFCSQTQRRLDALQILGQTYVLDHVPGQVLGDVSRAFRLRANHNPQPYLTKRRNIKLYIILS